MSPPDTATAPRRSLPSLAARAQLGDRDALDRLLRQLQSPLLQHVRGIVQDDDLAADVLQDVMLQICRRLRTVREVQWVRAWAYRIASREAVRAARASRGSVLDDFDAQAHELPAPDREDAVLDPELLAELPHRLAALPPAAQIVVRLHYLQELTQPEIAEALEIPLGTVKSRIAYGLAALRRAWSGVK